MKLPIEAKRLSLQDPEVPQFVYPPLGFWGINDYGLGNGDIFGLYWPIGREKEEPIVCETWHDTREIAPYFSSAERFLASVETDDEFEQSYLNCDVTTDFDPKSAFANFHSAKEAVKNNQVDNAIVRLETAITTLPEYTDALALLCTQYRRVGRQEDAICIGHRMMMSPPCFGRSSPQILGWLCKQTPTAELEDDPLWKILVKLRWKFGGEKLNDDFPLLREVIDQYLESGKTVEALRLMQTYGECMSFETVSFQERYDFSRLKFVQWQAEISEKSHGHSRVPAKV